uniref:Uncharacterized protein n=1 Tax=Arundo donax TaxID=35708 RepID=A0A0A8ZIS9_ARUDO
MECLLLKLVCSWGQFSWMWASCFTTIV